MLATHRPVCVQQQSSTLLEPALDTQFTEVANASEITVNISVEFEPCATAQELPGISLIRQHQLMHIT